MPQMENYYFFFFFFFFKFRCPRFRHITVHKKCLIPLPLFVHPYLHKSISISYLHIVGKKYDSFITPYSKSSIFSSKWPYTIKIQNIGTDGSDQTVKVQIRLFFEKQSNQGLHCLQVHQHLLDIFMH